MARVFFGGRLQRDCDSSFRYDSTPVSRYSWLCWVLLLLEDSIDFWGMKCKLVARLQEKIRGLEGSRSCNIVQQQKTETS